MRKNLLLGFLMACCTMLIARPGDVLFATNVVHELRLNFSDPFYWDSLISSHVTENNVIGQVTFDGTVLDSCGIKTKGFNLALKDCIRVTKLKPDWGKAWGRLGASLYGLEKYNDAMTAYVKANELDPNDIYTKMIDTIKGKTKIDRRRLRTNKVESFFLNGDEPSFVDMPIWYTHNITNVGEDILYTCFWINEPYNPNDPDTYFQTV